MSKEIGKYMRGHLGELDSEWVSDFVIYSIKKYLKKKVMYEENR